MKTPRIILIIAGAFGLAGCQNWPKDSYISGARSTVNTPWGPSTLEADVVATGKAASLVTLEQLEARVRELKRKQAEGK